MGLLRNIGQYLFKGKTGNDIADRIFEALQKSENGLTRTDITNLFDRHQSRERIDEALDLLRKYKRIHIARETTGGRPTERVMKDAKEAKKAP